MLYLAGQHQRMRCIVRGICWGSYMCRISEWRQTRKVLAGLQHAVTRQDLRGCEGSKALGGPESLETMAAHAESTDQLRLDYVNHPTSAAILRAVARCGGHRSPSASETKRLCSSTHYCAFHIDDILQVVLVKPTIHHVVYHIGFKDVDRCEKDDTAKFERSADSDAQLGESRS